MEIKDNSVVKTTKRHYKLFKEECKLWLDIFGITNWDVKYVIDNDDDMAASCTYRPESRIAILALNSSFYLPIEDCETSVGIDEIIRQFAFHEVCELLVCEFDDVAKTRFDVSFDDVTTIRHRLIKNLENVVFKKCRSLLGKEVTKRKGL